MCLLTWLPARLFGLLLKSVITDEMMESINDNIAETAKEMGIEL